MNDKLWNILEKPNSYPHIKDDDLCIYAREYVAGGYGYKGGPTNQLIINLKKTPPLKINSLEWKYRERCAIEVFAMETVQLSRLKTVTAIPSSRTKNHPKYDNRFENFFARLLKSRSCLSVEWPVEIKKTVPASRCQGNRDPKSIKKNYSWRGFKKQTTRRVIYF